MVDEEVVELFHVQLVLFGGNGFCVTLGLPLVDFLLLALNLLVVVLL